MKLNLRVSNAGVQEILRSYVERRLQFALGRFGGRIGMISIHLDSTRAEHRCRIDAELLPFGTISAEGTALESFSAIDRAAGRLGRRISRELDRRTDQRTHRESIRYVA